jgi:hypothetical protein
MAQDALQVVAAVTAAEMERFIRVPMAVNAGDPNYVAPLLVERREALSAKTNPFFAHAEVRFWLAVRDGRDVGRISAQIDRLTAGQGERIGHFGLISAIDDPAVFAALFAAAEAWLAENGCEVALGPLNLSINEEVGLLVDGFDSPPMLMMGHDPPYAGGRIEAQGYAKAKDVYAYLADNSRDLDFGPWGRMRRHLPEGVKVRQLDMARFEEEVRTLTEILNDAWSDNWGFTPTTEAETMQLAKSMKLLIDPRMAWFAEIDGETAGFVIFLPNLNEATRDLGGRLAPFGWIKLLWRLKIRRVGSARCPLMGVRKKFTKGLKGRMLPFILMEACGTAARKLGYFKIEFSWVLEDNTAMRKISDAVGARIYKTYRIYRKALG